MEPNGAFAAWLPAPPGPTPVLDFTATLDGRTITGQGQSFGCLRATRPPISPDPLRVGCVFGDCRATPPTARRRDGRLRRAGFRGARRHLAPLGTRLPVDARTRDAVRLRLAKGVQVSVSAAEVDTDRPACPDPVSLGATTLAEQDQQVEVSVPVGSRSPRPWRSWALACAGRCSARAIRATSCHPRPCTDACAAQRAGGPAGGADLELRLASPPAGWRTRWTGGQLMLELRTPRAAGSGLTDLVVALDAGHPPGGAIGPTGLQEDSVTLAVAQAAARALGRLGARPFLVRQDARPLSLAARTATA